MTFQSVRTTIHGRCAQTLVCSVCILFGIGVGMRLPALRSRSTAPTVVPVVIPVAIRAPIAPAGDLRWLAPPIPPGATHVRRDASEPALIAAWSEDRVFVSVGAPDTFVRVVEAAHSVRDVAFDCYGRVVVVMADLPERRTDLLTGATDDIPIAVHLTTTGLDQLEDGCARASGAGANTP
ncbi:MAG: hypothetical protein JWO36_6633 [Myxococcales bacterium]|nr:hypothetical protein [Myxococcales bacterium]